MALSYSNYAMINGALNIVEIVFQAVLIYVSVGWLTREFHVDVGWAVVGELKLATIGMDICASVIPLKPVVAMLLFRSLRKPDRQIVTVWSVDMAIFAILHFVAFCLSADVARQAVEISNVTTADVGAVITAAFFHFCSMVLFAVHSCMQLCFKHLLPGEN